MSPNEIPELSNHSRTLDVMSRYESRYEGQYLRFHRRLMEIRGQRPPSAHSPLLVPKPQPFPAPEAEKVKLPNEATEVKITRARYLWVIEAALDEDLDPIN